MRETVVFDLDGTLIQGDSFVAFLLTVLRVTPQRCWRTIHLPFAVIVYKLGIRDNTWLKRCFLHAILAGLSKDQVEAYGEQFTQKLLDQLRPGARDRIEQHRQRGDRLVLASASPDVYVQSVAKALGFDACICTRLAQLPNGCLSGELIDGNCYGAAKLARLEEALQQEVATDLSGEVRLIHWAYSDHQADIPLLTSAQHGIAVNPTTALLRVCARYGLVVEDWSRNRASV